MTELKTSAVYDNLASVWNQHWGEVSSQKFMPIIDNMVLTQLEPGMKVLDVCCGTGQMSRHLISKGLDVTGVDISKEMIRIASKNAPHGKFIVSDAREISFENQFDAALCTFDSFNHFLDFGGVQAVLDNVYVSLKKGGIFFFDINDEKGFQNRWQGSLTVSGENHLFHANITYNQPQCLGVSEITLVEEVDKVWNHKQFDILAQHHELRSVNNAAKMAGFSAVAAFDATVDFGMLDDEGREFFLCKK